MPTNYANTTPSIAPWDTLGLLDRSPDERCRWHDGHCAYRDDDPNRCTLCHASIDLKKCTCEHGPLTLDHTDAIRDQFKTGLPLRGLAQAHSMSIDQTRKILKGLYNRVRHAPRNKTANDENDFWAAQ